VSIKKDGSRSVAHAKGYVKNDFNTFLKIYFNPLIGGNYFILDLDVDYKWVVIGTPCRDLFWILARESSISDDLLNEKL
jgi:apolipoprotein D and lipocalin family protein